MTRNKLQLFTHFKNCIILAIVQKISYFQLLDLVYFRSNRIIWMKLFSTTTGVIVGVGVCFSLNENNLVFLILILRFFFCNCDVFKIILTNVLRLFLPQKSLNIWTLNKNKIYFLTWFTSFMYPVLADFQRLARRF